MTVPVLDGAAASAWALHLEGLAKRYGPEVLFRGLSLTVRPGEAIRVSGPNGSGKTQLLMSVGGFVDLDGGVLHLSLGTGRSSISGSPFRRDHQVRFIPSLPGEICALDIASAVYVLARNLSPFSLRNTHKVAVDGFFTGRRAELEYWVGEELTPDRRFSALSLGQQKRLLLASVLLARPRPRVLLVDEPLAGLDPQGVAQALRQLEDARTQGVALLVAEHRGEIDALVFDGEVRLPYPATDEGNGKVMSAREIPSPSTMVQESGEALLTLSHLQAGYPGSEISCRELAIRPGALVLIEGTNGSGKTGFLRGLLGFPPADVSGDLEWRGTGVTALNEALRRSEVRYLDQERSSFDQMRVSDALRVAVPRGRVLSKVLSGATEHLDSDKLVSSLSSGSRALATLVQCLAGEPRLAVLDEPFANVDPENRGRMMELIAMARRQWNTAFIVVEHTGRGLESTLRLRVDVTSKKLVPVDCGTGEAR